MKRLLVLLLAALFLFAGPVCAQDEMDDSPAAPADAKPKAGNTALSAKQVPTPAAGPGAAPVPSPADEPASPAAPVGTMNEMGVAELQALDKITARVSHLEIKVGDTTTFGSLNIAVKACRKAPAENTPESAVFLQVWEQNPGEESHWVYSGWMFASSPALAAMDHPVYDIWLLDCKNAETSADSPKSDRPDAKLP